MKSGVKESLRDNYKIVPEGDTITPLSTLHTSISIRVLVGLGALGLQVKFLLGDLPDPLPETLGPGLQFPAPGGENCGDGAGGTVPSGHYSPLPERF